MMSVAYIGIGSNLADPLLQVSQAIQALSELRETRLVRLSSLYKSAPMGPQDQPDYINAVVKLETKLSPLELLDSTQNIEQQHGRVRKAERWGPRTLDLDILLFDNITIQSERLTVPHYGMKVREFVLYPLAEIEPDFIFPDGDRLQDLLMNVDRNGLRVWQSLPAPSKD